MTNNETKQTLGDVLGTLDALTPDEERQIATWQTCPRCPPPREGRREKMRRLHVPTIAAWQCARCLAVYVSSSA